MRVGIFGGTFDPFHLGHLGVTIHLREMCNFDEVWIVPAAQSPLKTHEAVSAEHRKAMIGVAIDGVEGLALNEVDLERPGPSYTVDTLRILRERYPEVDFSLCMSNDVAQSLPKWRAIDEIMAQVPIVVSRRFPGIELPMECVETPIVEIEATIIRERLKNHLTCVHLLPAPVLAYIQKHQLYVTLPSFGDE